MFGITSAVFVFALAAAAPYNSQLETPEHTVADVRGPTTKSVPPEAVRPITPELRADVYMARKMYREAIETYEQAPQNAVILNKIGIAYHQMLDFRTAEKYYKRAIKKDPHYAEAINNLGTIDYTKKSYRRAVKLYKKALRYRPNAASIYSNLGTAYFARKDYKRCAIAYQKALSLDPDVFERHSSNGILLQERTVEERAKFHFFLAKTYAKANMNDLALRYIRKALEEGFKERKKFEEEPEFANLRKLPEFQELMALEPRVL